MEIDSFFEYKGKHFSNPKQVIDQALTLSGETQREFIDAYCHSSPYARDYVGYFAGYYSPKIAHEILGIFETEHPIFGKRLGSVTAQEAYQAGLALGRKAAHGQERQDSEEETGYTLPTQKIVFRNGNPFHG